MDFGTTLTEVAPLLIPIIALMIPLLTIWSKSQARIARNRELHETIRGMVDKGLAVPPELLAQTAATEPPPARSWTPETNLRGGLINLGVGAGLTVFFLVIKPEQGLWAIGAIPFFLGAALLVAWYVETRRP